MKDWREKKVLVIGAARQGVAASRFLARQGAKVTLNDRKPKNEFNKLIRELSELNINFHFGDHSPSLLENIDIICTSGGVSLEIPLIQIALQSNIPLTNDSQIFMESVSSKVIGITGSAGKTTTTILLGEIAKKSSSSRFNVWVGGNIGYPMIDHIDKIHKDDWVIVEFSSFQLELMTISPKIALILNITPNHLDRHKDMQTYINAKKRILTFQNNQDVAILNWDDQNTKSLSREVKGDIISFSKHASFDTEKNVYLKEEMVFVRNCNNETPLIATDCLKLPGNHNVINMLAACAASYAAGFPFQAMYAGITEVNAIPHRLQLVREYKGVRWIDDSIATTPERVMSALDAIPSPLVLLLGGRDKNLPWEELAKKINQRNPKVILFGEAGELIQSTLSQYQATQNAYFLTTVKDLKQAVQKASEICIKGETVLLSPGCTSYDAYQDFEERGEHFITLVKELK